MRQTIRLGRVAGIPLGMHWSVLVIAALLANALAIAVLPVGAPGRPAWQYWFVAVGATVVFFLSLVAHEFAHALVARRNGLTVRRITLWLLGGVSEIDGDAPTPGVEFRLAIAGPATSAAAALLFGAVYVGAEALSLPVVIVTGLYWLAFVNLLLAGFNLLPGAPLDGGRVLHAILWRRFGDRDRAQAAASRAGSAIGMGLIALGFLELYAGAGGGLWLMLVGAFLMMAARAEESNAVTRGALAGRTVADVMCPDPVCGYAHQSVQGFVDTVAAHSRHRVFPVLRLSGEVAGAVSLAALSRVPPAARATTRIEAVARPTTVLPVDAPAIALLRTPLAAGRLVVVVDGERTVGVVTAEDVARVMELTALGAAPTAGGPAGFGPTGFGPTGEQQGGSVGAPDVRPPARLGA